jgi:uncharacterized lipoprotein YmbA
MGKYKKWINVVLILFIVIFFQLGCGSSKPSRFYVLTPILDVEGGMGLSDSEAEISVGIDMLLMPEHLLKPQIATHTSTNQIEYAEYDRWAESLDENFVHVLAENLSKLLPSENVYIFPWKSSTILQYYMTFEIMQFSQGADENIALTVFWSIYDNATTKELLRKKTTLKQQGPTSDPLDYGRLVQVMSQLVEEFSREIATELKKIARRQQ